MTRYGSKVVMQFQTAWNTPRGWLCAIFNALKLSFTVEHFSEGESVGWVEVFDYSKMESGFGAWTKRNATPEENDELGNLLWGEESWAEISASREGEVGI
jgi:hypothetical protein